jgi:hypothetical protein
MKYSFLWALGGLFVAGLQLASCSDDDPAPRTRADFCEDWAEAACSDETVSACQAPSQDTCRQAQQTYCLDTVPVTFSDARGNACIDAVRDAYDDADLTGTELDTVQRLRGDCSGIVTGTRALGQSCDTDNDCDRSEGVECVRRGGVRGGICQVPEEVGAGQACSDPAQTCSEGFFCDGNNCIATKGAGVTCQNDVECGSGGFCGPDDTCVTRRAVGAECDTNDECASLLCYEVDGDRACAEVVRLSPAEPLCEDLR